MITASLPKEFMPIALDDIIRLGNKFDGGYLIPKSDILSSEHLISFGVETDWSFEKAFTDLNPVGVQAYDASTSPKLFLKRSLGSLVKLELGTAISKPFEYFAFKRYFQKERQFHKKFVGFDSDGLFVSLRTILDNVESTSIFLKMDIEGAEYRCLDDILHCQDKLSGLAIEFHDVDIHLERILEFLNDFDLAIAHVHCNNAGLVNPSGIPMVIEVTFTRQPETSEQTAPLPHPLDGPCHPKMPEIELRFGEPTS